MTPRLVQNQFIKLVVFSMPEMFERKNTAKDLLDKIDAFLVQ